MKHIFNVVLSQIDLVCLEFSPASVTRGLNLCWWKRSFIMIHLDNPLSACFLNLSHPCLVPIPVCFRSLFGSDPSLFPILVCFRSLLGSDPCLFPIPVWFRSLFGFDPCLVPIPVCFGSCLVPIPVCFGSCLVLIRCFEVIWFV